MPQLLARAIFINFLSHMKILKTKQRRWGWFELIKTFKSSGEHRYFDGATASAHSAKLDSATCEHMGIIRKYSQSEDFQIRQRDRVNWRHIVPASHANTYIWRIKFKNLLTFATLFAINFNIKNYVLLIPLTIRARKGATNFSILI